MTAPSSGGSGTSRPCRGGPVGIWTWLVLELARFRDSSFKDAWTYVLVMVVIEALYRPGRNGTRGPAMPEMTSIDAEPADQA